MMIDDIFKDYPLKLFRKLKLYIKRRIQK